MNIIRIGILYSENFCIDSGHLDRLREKWDYDAPETNLFEEPGSFYEAPGILMVRCFWWCGSRASLETLKQILAEFSGRADLVVVLEDGYVIGVRLRDGKVSIHNILITFGSERP